MRDTYSELRESIHTTLISGLSRVEEAKVTAYWETGRLINEYLDRSEGDYQEWGKQIISRLSKDLKLGEKVFYRCMRFAQKINIFSARRKLSWAHYRALIAVGDEKKRLALADRAEKGKWTSRALEIKIRDMRKALRKKERGEEPVALLPVPELGPFCSYPVIQRGEKSFLDLGFSVYREAGGVKGTEPTFVYRAFVERVIDGDTLKARIDLGFNIQIDQTIRLKGIDCPEMSTKEGVTAKNFVVQTLQDQEWITLKTSRPDKYDRYLGDVVIPEKNSPGIYLNNLLLEKRLAVKVGS